MKQCNCHNKREIYIIIQKIFGHEVIVDIDCPKNYVAKCVLEYFENPNGSKPESDIPDRIYQSLHGKERWYPYSAAIMDGQPAFKYLWTDFVKGYDGVVRECDLYRIKFEYEGRTYTEEFYEDSSLCDICNEENKVIMILGQDFFCKSEIIARKQFE